MIGLVLSMVRARAGQALTAFLLAMFAMAAAVSAPVYSATADRAVVRSEVAAAPVAERVLQARRTQPKSGDHDFEDLVPEVFDGAQFTSVYSTEYDTMIFPADVVKYQPIAPRLVYRDDTCAHLRFSAGRCFVSESEVVLSTAQVKQLDLHLGDTFEISYATVDPEGGDFVEAGPRVRFTLVGVYDPINPADLYWSDADYFNPRQTARMTTEPAFVNRLTMEAMEHGPERQIFDFVIDWSRIDRESLDSINAAVKHGEAQLTGLPGHVVVETKLPALAKRINADRDLVAQVVPVAAVPLVLLCWFVLFIAVAAATQERRLELGLLSLRGVSTPRRWWLAAGESIVAILAGAASGFVLGHYLVRLAAQLLLSSAGDVPLSAGLTLWSLAALVGALVAAVLAQRAELVKRTSDLLRNVPSRASRWGAPVFEVLVVVLAAVSVVQLRRGGEGLTGFALVAPSAVVIAVALLAARAVLPIAEAVGRRALRRGRLGPTLAAYALTRRPGTQRILALFVVALGLMVFAATAADASADARDRRNRVELGAPRVLSVEPLSRASLLSKVRAVDKDHKFAMATAMLPVGDDTGVPPMLAVDSEALPAVALWEDKALSAQKASELLKPPTSQRSIEVDNKDVSLDATIDSLVDAYRVHWVAVVVPYDGSGVGRVDLGLVQTGRHTYVRNLPMCVNGCRLAGLELQQPENRGFDVTMTLHSLSQHDKKVIDEAAFANPDGWRTPESPGPRLLVPTLTAAKDGLRAELTNYKGADTSVKILPTDAPSPLPVIMARTAGIGDHMTGLDENRQSIAIAGEVETVPKLGYHGGLVDLEYAERLAADGGDALYPQIFLGPQAPADVIEQLQAQGLRIMSDRSLGPLRAAMDEQGPAVALRFHQLAAGLAVLLGAGALWLVASLDRLRRAGELRSLRAQGVTRRDAGANGYLALVGTAALIAPFAALASWLLVREYLPVFSDDADGFEASIWPSPEPVAIAWGAAALVLAASAVVAGARMRAASEQRRR
ncbi:ABC transporter permease [Dactylosporangium salmoneum]|uniref:ABC3 transporter permease C-terminal domain-containing protein n=1 Tax=Dactylosporangium salmoneum TaxID=53361 RepID=A0ABP5TXV2_9ACTN